MRRFLLISLCAILFSPAVYAGADHSMEPYTGSAPFEKLKTLEGKWSGTVTGGNQKPETMTVTYETSSGKTALIEKLAAGTPGEMVSIYNDENDSLVMTHYCMMRNQPKLKLISGDDKQIELEMTEDSNGVKMQDDHMHALKITFDGPDEITQQWTGYEKGKLSDNPVIIKLKRV